MSPDKPMSRTAQKQSMRLIFGNVPCAFLPTFQEAINIAQQLPEGCNIVWLWTEAGRAETQNYRVCRQPVMCQAQRENEPGSFCYRVWENGITEVPESEHAGMQGVARRVPKPSEPSPPPPAVVKLKKLQRGILQTTKNLLAYGDCTFERCIENLQGDGFDVSELLAYKEEKGNPSPVISPTPSFAPIPALAQVDAPEAGATHSRPEAQKIYDAAKTVNGKLGDGMVSIKSLIARLRKAGLSAEAILDIVSGE